MSSIELNFVKLKTTFIPKCVLTDTQLRGHNWVHFTYRP